jgi:predicted nucleic acid-binding protein
VIYFRERHLTRREAATTLKEFEQDERDGVWQWFSLTSALLEKARQHVLGLPSSLVVRSGDALHLTCAEEHGFQEVYTNDRHMLQAARHFNVVGVNLLDE